MNVELYARTSTKDGRQTPELQIEELRRYAALRGWNVVHETIEEISGYEKKRPKFEEVLRRIEGGESRGLLSVELSRWGRSLHHLIETAMRLRTVDGQLIATRQNIDTSTPIGRYMFNSLGAAAEFEHDLIQERVTAGVRHAIEKREGSWGRPREGIPMEALQQASNHVTRAGLSWAEASRLLAKVGYMQPAKTTGKRQHPARPWPTGTLQDAVERVGLPAAPEWRPGQAPR